MLYRLQIKRIVKNTLCLSSALTPNIMISCQTLMNQSLTITLAQAWLDPPQLHLVYIKNYPFLSQPNHNLNHNTNPNTTKKLGETQYSPKTTTTTTTHHKIKLHERTRIERYLENKSCQSIYINLKNSPIGPKKAQNDPRKA